ncbi:7-cyano-7-deazaguanine synthase QueC [Acidocella sp.]|uniref:7-cyano-7-deazaguanine synthase QueC n=1 Tax=Acidocella sp. TaxID=50710 RepID=UPI0017B19EB7|nr:7-cyano-7-deazaguanine synthase QueC [Acidocella sp.]NNM58010.1 7-cyano-7-deazaguanine synthase QueC [Acidocella sp.]
MDQNRKALVLFSGGQDSTTCLAWALEHFTTVETLGFTYGQRHGIEMSVRGPVREAIRAGFPAWAEKLGEDHVIDLAVLGQVSESALTRESEITLAASGLPTTFVPGRNLVFLTFAAMLAYRRGARHIIGGMCETDFSGYPDCRDDSVKAMQLALNTGMGTNFVLHTPLMWIDKAQTWKLAQTLGGAALVELIRTGTHTCYNGERGQLHGWGYGCGTCPACVLRAQGYTQFKTC